MNDHLRLCSLVTRWLRDEATGLVTNKVYADGKEKIDDETRHGVDSDKEAEWEKKYDVH